MRFLFSYLARDETGINSLIDAILDSSRFLFLYDFIERRKENRGDEERNVINDVERKKKNKEVIGNRKKRKITWLKERCVSNFISVLLLFPPSVFFFFRGEASRGHLEANSVIPPPQPLIFIILRIDDRRNDFWFFRLKIVERFCFLSVYSLVDLLVYIDWH